MWVSQERKHGLVSYMVVTLVQLLNKAGFSEPTSDKCLSPVTVVGKIQG